VAVLAVARRPHLCCVSVAPREMHHTITEARTAGLMEPTSLCRKLNATFPSSEPSPVARAEITHRQKFGVEGDPDTA